MLRKVSCWPAKLASGRSSAVALERTATDGFRLARAAGSLGIGRADRGLGVRGPFAFEDRLADARAGLLQRRLARPAVHGGIDPSSPLAVM